MIVLVAAGEEKQHRNLRGVKRGVIAGAEAAGLFRDLKAELAAKAIDQRVELFGGPGAVDNQFLAIQPTDHVEIEHGDGGLERRQRIAHVAGAADQAALLAGERDEDDPPRQLLLAASQFVGNFDEHR